MPEATAPSQGAHDAQVAHWQRAFWESTSELLCVIGPNGYFKAVNPAWTALLGYSEDELTAVPYLEFVHPSDHGITEAEAGRPSTPDSARDFTNRFRARDGRYHSLQWVTTPNMPGGIRLASARDVTAALSRAARRGVRARADSDLVEAGISERTAELTAAVKELDAFAYTVSHDLRAPLRAIDGFSRLLVDEHGDSLSPEGVRMLGRVRKNAQQMGSLIDELLRFSRLDRSAPELSVVSPAEIAAEVVSEFAGNAEPCPAVRVEPTPTCRADPVLLHQVYANLIGNACKFTRDAEQPDIVVGCDASGPVPVYFVRDNGVGFDMQYAGRLFGVFQRLHRMEEFEGTGIGLATVQRIVQRHGGKIWADASPGRGATFSFTLESDRG